MQVDLKAHAAELRKLDRELESSFSGPLVSDTGKGKGPCGGVGVSHGVHVSVSLSITPRKP